MLAGAGSGKTKMLTSRIAYLVEGQGVPPYQILAVTFTNKAAGEMRERVEKILQRVRIRAIWARPRSGRFTRSASACFVARWRTAVHEAVRDLRRLRSAFADQRRDEQACDRREVGQPQERSRARSIAPSATRWSPRTSIRRAHNFFDRQFKRIYEQYQKDMFTNNALDFGEIICLIYRLLRDHRGVREKYQRRFRYIHVDEYQDTNRAQYLLLSMLAQVPWRAPEYLRRGRRGSVHLQMARRGHPEHPGFRARLSGRPGGEARAELPLDARRSSRPRAT